MKPFSFLIGYIKLILIIIEHISGVFKKTTQYKYLRERIGLFYQVILKCILNQYSSVCIKQIRNFD